MAVFRSPAKQAASVMRELQGSHLKSVGTVRNYEQCLTRVTEWTQTHKLSDGLRGLTVEQAKTYLAERAQAVGQKTLDMERQAVQAMLTHVTGRLATGERLPVTKSDTPQVLTPRAYSPQQVALICARMTPHNALATEIAYTAGLRAHELLTLQRRDEQAPDLRPARDEKFAGRPGELYVVIGKGGLTREIQLPSPLAVRLEQCRLDTARQVTDRGIHYQQHYAIGGGQPWSNAFSRASTTVLGWSKGGHGLRHSYAQDRVMELQTLRLSQEAAKEVVSQELGHFRPEITDTYLR